MAGDDVADDKTKKVSLIDLMMHFVVFMVMSFAITLFGNIIFLPLFTAAFTFVGIGANAGTSGWAVSTLLLFLGTSWAFWKYLRGGNDIETAASICTKLAMFFGVIAIIGICIYLLVSWVVGSMGAAVCDSPSCPPGLVCDMPTLCSQTRTLLTMSSMIFLVITIQLALVRELGKRVWK